MPPKQSTVKKLPTALQPDQAEDAKLLVQVIDYYHQTLLQSPEALAYLQRRGIGSPEAITTFKLGFANRTLGYRLPEQAAWKARRCAGSCSASGCCASQRARALQRLDRDPGDRRER